MVDRLNASAMALDVLLKQVEDNNAIEYSCGIMLRTIFLDLIILLNAFSITRNPDNSMVNELEQFCFDTMGDSVRHTLENLKALYSQHPGNVIKTMYSKLVAENPQFFEPYANDGTYPVLKVMKKYTNKELAKTVKDSAELANYKDIYDAYLFYSKYDHFGQIFHTISKQDFLVRLDRVNKSITYIPFAFIFSITILLIASPSADLEKQFFEIKAYIENDPSIGAR